MSADARPARAPGGDPAGPTPVAGGQPWPAERPDGVPPGAGEAHVWCAGLDDARGGARLESWLSPAEAERIGRVRPSLARRRLAAARGVLREVLGAYLGVPPLAVPLVADPGGKPRLERTLNPGSPRLSLLHPTLAFNLSHSGGLALIGVASGGRVGVDVEEVRPVPAAEALVRRFFTERERAAFEAEGDPVEHARLFLRAWTRKEACVKALGAGFWAAGRRFEVSSARDEPARVIAVDGDPQRAHAWSLFHLEPAPGFLGALAVEGAVGSVRALRLAAPRAGAP